MIFEVVANSVILEWKNFQRQDFVKFVGIVFLRSVTRKMSKDGVLSGFLRRRKTVLLPVLMKFWISVNFCFELEPKFRPYPKS